MVESCLRYPVAPRFDVLAMVSVKLRSDLGLDGSSPLCSLSFALDACFWLHLDFSEGVFKVTGATSEYV
ncbi:hypothetical protein Bca4012_014546 [Brassica carinata]